MIFVPVLRPPLGAINARVLLPAALSATGAPSGSVSCYSGECHMFAILNVNKITRPLNTSAEKRLRNVV